MDRTQQRFERFAQLRAAYPDANYDEIMQRIHDEERDEDEAAEGRWIIDEIENRADADDWMHPQEVPAHLRWQRGL